MKLITTIVSTAALAAMLAAGPAAADNRSRHGGFHAKQHQTQRHHAQRHHFQRHQAQRHHGWRNDRHFGHRGHSAGGRWGDHGNPRAHAPQGRHFGHGAHAGRGWERDGHRGLHRGHAHAPAHGFDRNAMHRGERPSFPQRHDRAEWRRDRDRDHGGAQRGHDRGDEGRADRGGAQRGGSGAGDHDRGGSRFAMNRDGR